MHLPRRGRKVSPGESPVPRGRAPGMPGVPQLFPCQEGPVTIGGAEAQDRPICPHLWATKAGPRAHPKLAAAPSAPSPPQAGCRRGRWRRRLGGQHVLGPFRGAPPSGSCQVSERIRLPLPSPPSRWWGARPTRRREVLGATPKKTEQAGGSPSWAGCAAPGGAALPMGSCHPAGELPTKGGCALWRAAPDPSSLQVQLCPGTQPVPPCPHGSGGGGGDSSIRTTSTTKSPCQPSLPRCSVGDQTCVSNLTYWTVPLDSPRRLDFSVSRLSSFVPHQTHSLLWSPWGKWPTLCLVTIQKLEFPLHFPPLLSISSHALSSFLCQHPLGCPRNHHCLPRLPPPPPSPENQSSRPHFSPGCGASEQLSNEGALLFQNLLW